MANEYKLSYTAAEINNRLGQVSQLSEEIADEVKARENAISALEVKMNQMSLNIAEGDTVEDAIAWLEENGDPSLVYLLPDNYFYKHKYVEGSGAAYTNQIPISTDTSGAIYGEDYTGDGVNDGYKQNVRMGSDGADRTGATGKHTTGFIPCTKGGILYLDNCQIDTGAGTSAYQELCTYDSTKKFLSKAILATSNMTALNYEVDGNGYLTMLDTSSLGSAHANMAFVRLSGNYIGADSIITVNEEIVDAPVGGYQWARTGNSLVQNDNEDRINDLEAENAEQNEKIADIEETLKNGVVADDGVPTYVKAEAKEVVDKVVQKRTINSLVLLMGADIHVSAGETVRTAIKHMGQGMNEICNYITPDGAVFLGDYNYNATPLSKAQGIDDMKYFGYCIAEIRKAMLTILINGNHDYYSTSTSDTTNRLSENEVYALIGSHNTDKAVVDVNNVGRNYGYVDFEKQRIRLIYLNTTDIAGVTYTSHLISTVQGQWFVNTALDLSDKEDEEKWGVIVCGHIPLFDNPQVPTVLGKFKDKASGGNNFGMTYDFSNVKAELIGVFHGHIHNFKVTEKTTSGGNTIKYIGIPNAVPDRENPYTTTDYYEVDANGNGVSYPKTAGTAEDTSFNTVVIDRDNRKIHAICYGAGYDREISY